MPNEDMKETEKIVESEKGGDVEEVEIGQEDIQIIKSNLLKLSQYLQILGQTMEQFEMAKSNILTAVSKCREDHEKITGAILERLGHKNARVIDIDYDGHKLKIVKGPDCGKGNK